MDEKVQSATRQDIKNEIRDFVRYVCIKIPILNTLKIKSHQSQTKTKHEQTNCNSAEQRVIKNNWEN